MAVVVAIRTKSIITMTTAATTTLWAGTTSIATKTLATASGAGLKEASSKNRRFRLLKNPHFFHPFGSAYPGSTRLSNRCFVFRGIVRTFNWGTTPRHPCCLEGWTKPSRSLRWLPGWRSKRFSELRRTQYRKEVRSVFGSVCVGCLFPYTTLRLKHWWWRLAWVQRAGDAQADWEYGGKKAAWLGHKRMFVAALLSLLFSLRKPACKFIGVKHIVSRQWQTVGSDEDGDQKSRMVHFDNSNSNERRTNWLNEPTTVAAVASVASGSKASCTPSHICCLRLSRFLPFKLRPV